MVTLEQVKQLEKNCNVNLRYCEILSDEQDEDNNKRFRFLKSGNKYYYHEMHNGEVTQCFEVIIDWGTKDFTLYSFTPDGVHIYQIRSNKPSKIENIKKLEKSQITKGVTCQLNGVSIQYVDENEILINGKSITVTESNEFTYKLLKRSIKAIDRAKGLYIFLDNIAEHGKFEKYPLFSSVFTVLSEKYCA